MTVMVLLPVGVWVGAELVAAWPPQPVSCIAAIPASRARASRKNRVREFFPDRRRWPLRVARKPSPSSRARAPDAAVCRPIERPGLVACATPTLVATVRVDVTGVVLVGVSVVGLKVQVVNWGRPEQTNPTVWVKPFTGVTVMVVVPLWPRVTVTADGLKATVKLGAALTISVRAVEGGCEVVRVACVLDRDGMSSNGERRCDEGCRPCPIEYAVAQYCRAVEEGDVAGGNGCVAADAGDGCSEGDGLCGRAAGFREEGEAVLLNWQSSAGALTTCGRGRSAAERRRFVSAL